MVGALTNSQLKHLRGLAHNAPPALQVGKKGLTSEFLQVFESTLANRELLKLRFSNFKEERNELSASLVATTGAALVSLVGHTAVFYRQSPDPDKRKIVLPRPVAQN
jgi:RNA-binding protein